MRGDVLHGPRDVRFKEPEAPKLISPLEAAGQRHACDAGKREQKCYRGWAGGGEEARV